MTRGPLHVLDPIAGKLRPWYDPASDLYAHDFAACARRRESGPATDYRLFRMLLDFTDSARIRRGKRGRPRAAQLELARRIDELHRRGAAWPRLLKSAGDPDGGSFVFCPSACGVDRPRSRRIDRGYCVRWTGAFWAPCGTLRDLVPSPARRSASVGP